ncbi:hypothetical protein ACFSKL_06585 [Belliella marina]|uniref:6-bladed beta-propeller protein n=1 Tax=Belliella marina TaxID=1644146 RepID=A0ABW4VID1_9BACT
MKRQIFFFISIFLIFSCSEKSNENNGEPENLTLVKVDSLQIPYLGLLQLMDVHPQTGKVLMFNSQTRALLVGDFDGASTKEFNKTGDMPDSFGMFPLGAGKFNENGQNFTIISNQGVYTYDLEGNLIHGGKHQVKEMPAFSGRASADMEFYWVGDRILTVGAGRTAYPRNTPEFYENYTSFAWFDTLDRQVEQFMNLDEGSFFRNGKAHDISHIIPRLAVDKESMYFIQGIEPALNIHSLSSPNEKIKRVEFNIEDYSFNQGEDFKDADPRMISPDLYSGKFENIKSLGNYILTSFFPGVPESDRDRYENLNWMDFLAKARIDYSHRMLVLDNEGNKISEFAIPLEMDSRQWLVRDGYIWFLAAENLEQEEDFIKIYKVKLGEG